MNSTNIQIEKIGRSLLLLFLVFLSNTLHAQSKRVQFKGAARSVMFYDNLSGNLMDTDTTNTDKSFNGSAQLDLGIHINPNKSTHIETELRLNSTLGGFWGAGINLEVRKLLVEGVIAKKFKYKFGDFNFNLTPYTFQYNTEELNVNEPTIFRDYKDLIYYDNLILDTAWRQQGLMLDFGLQSDKVFESMDFKAFITRTRTGNIAAFPDRFFSGFAWKMKQSKYFSAGVTVIDLFDLAKTSKTDNQLNNLVATGNIKGQYFIGKTTLGIRAEAGLSRSDYKIDETSSKLLMDNFYDAGLFVKTDLGINAEISYKNVGVNFTSAGSQSKRVNWNTTPEVFNEITNAVSPRSPAMIDIYYDRTLYNQQIQQTIQTYVPKYSNALPYGPATPNRRGVTAKLNYKEVKKNFLDATVSFAYLTEIKGSGSLNLKQFSVLRGSANFHLNKLIDYDKKVLFSLGAQMENTSRAGGDFSSINLKSNMIEAGFEVEIFEKFDVLAGMKYFMSQGNEFLDIRNEFNEVVDFSKYSADERDVMYAGGLKYRFNKDIYITAQYIHDEIILFQNDENSYNFSRAMLVFNMKF